MMQLRQDNPPERMSDKIILEKVLGRQSNRLSGWGRSPSESQATCIGGSSRSTNAQAVNELKVLKAEHQALKDDFMKMRQLLIERDILPHSSLPPIEDNSRPSTRGASPTSDHDNFSDSDDIF